MNLTKQQIWILVGVGGLLATALLTSLLIKKRKKKKIMNTEGLVVKGGYIVPKGTPSMGDALHSFERRKSDGFGGRMSTKIKEQLVALYEKGINPEVTDLKVEVDSGGTHYHYYEGVTFNFMDEFKNRDDIMFVFMA